MKKLDILAIGDTVIDAFIRLQDAELICDTDKKNCKLAVRYGDKVPYESVTVCNAVGNAANAAVSASRLGLSSGMLTYVGSDQNGADCIAEFKTNNVATDLVRVADGMKTNYHYVLWYDVDRTILIKHEKYAYTLDGIPENSDAPKWLYVSSLGENSFHLYEDIAGYLDKNPSVKLAFQPGIFDIRQGVEKLAHIYSRAQAMCCNVEEAQRILGETSRDLKVLMAGLSKLGPKVVLVTDGIDGAYGYDTRLADEGFFFMPVYPHKPYERTGAGDAFFSTVVSCLAMGKLLDEALTWGPINSMSVVQQIGAQKGLLTVDKLQEFLKQAPPDYVLKKI